MATARTQGTHFDGYMAGGRGYTSLFGKQRGRDHVLAGVLCTVCGLDEVEEVEYVYPPFHGANGPRPGLIEAMRVRAVRGGRVVTALIWEREPDAPGTPLCHRLAGYTVEAARDAEWYAV